MATFIEAKKGEIIIDGFKLRCGPLHIVWGLNEVPYVTCQVVPSTDQGYPDRLHKLYEILKQHKYGDAVSIKYTMRPKTSGAEFESKTVFEGFIDSWAPVSVGKTTQLTLWCRHWSQSLDWNYSGSDSAVGPTASSYSLPPVTEEDASLVPYYGGRYTASDVLSNLFENIIKPELLKQTADTFFGKKNDAAAEALAKITGTLPLGAGTPDDVIADVRQALNCTVQTDVSLWDKLVRLAARYNFSMCPSVEGMVAGAVMYTVGGDPDDFVKLELDDVNMRMQDFSMRQWHSSSRMALIEGMTSTGSPFDITNRLQRSENHYADGADTPLTPGLCKLPSWLYPLHSAVKYAARTSGLAGTNFVASGHIVENGPSDDGDSFNTLYNQISGNGAKAVTEARLADQMYKDRTAIILAPLTFDIAPGTTVAIEPTGDRELEGKVLKGEPKLLIAVVRRVCQSMGVGSKMVGTRLVVSHIRNEEEQRNISWKTHPMYNQSFSPLPLLTL